MQKQIVEDLLDVSRIITGNPKHVLGAGLVELPTSGEVHAVARKCRRSSSSKPFARGDVD